MSEGFVIAKFKEVADGLQEGEFAIGERQKASSLDDLDPGYRDLRARALYLDVAEGFEQVPQAFCRLLSTKNLGEQS